MKKFVIVVVCLFAVLSLADRYFNITVADLLPPAPYEYTLTEQEKAMVEAKVPDPIPQEVYNMGTERNKWADVFYGDRKVAFLISGPGAPDLSAYKKMLRGVFGADMDLKLSYKRKIKRVASVEIAECVGEFCAMKYLGERCGPGFCIINPRLREMVVDHSRDPRIAAALLEKFKNW